MMQPPDDRRHPRRRRAHRRRGHPHADADEPDAVSEIIGAEVWLKFENLQFTAAYKERGALNKLLQLTAEERSRGVIAASAGNHAQAVAYHGKRLGIPVTIVMPASTPTIKVTQTEGHGATVVLHGDDVRRRATPRRASWTREQGYVFVHPFDDPQIIAGAGHNRARNARGRARARHVRRPHRRRRADVRHRALPRAR